VCLKHGYTPKLHEQIDGVAHIGVVPACGVDVSVVCPIRISAEFGGVYDKAPNLLSGTCTLRGELSHAATRERQNRTIGSRSGRNSRSRDDVYDHANSRKTHDKVSGVRIGAPYVLDCHFVESSVDTRCRCHEGRTDTCSELGASGNCQLRLEHL